MNPDWDKLEACQQSLREHMAMVRERDERIERMDERIERMREAAQAVVDRWHTPSWKDAEATAAVINRLESALAGRKP